MKEPIISIVVPCYNQAQYLNEALQSVSDQTYENWECIVINDGSPDNAEEIAEEWIAKDQRFKYYYQKNKGVSSARNLGITNSTGKFILPLDGDDKIAKDYIKQAVEAFENDESLKLVYCKAEKFGDESGIWNLIPFSLKKLALDNMIFCSAIYRKTDWELTGGYDNTMLEGLEDWEFWISLLKNGGNVLCLSTVGFYYRIKLVSRQKKLDATIKEKLFNYLSIKHADFFVEHLGSFVMLNNNLQKERQSFSIKLNSEKFVLDLFCKTFFGFTIFGKINKK
ncbi:glycosyltransferase family 2 protein [Flavobacterium collinsii]|uniref:Glyco_trans_2-like domain-containing protein n=1 Tax=Flavobacterium collinsii TaxID=1114861 RepID=A0A9W4TG29_9FLAO|nr:glycosyltransferase family A protein [Flavobacterium collinsii]CAI2765397.1 Glyco_trans_2-like domain-containing protein [Flavobacterium collinsii]